MLFSCATAFSAPENTTQQTTQETQENTQEETITAKSPHVLLLDMNTGAVLYSKSEGDKVFPSSLTTVMTALIVLEKCNLEERVTASESSVSNVPAGDNKLEII